MTATDEQVTAMTRAFNNAGERLPTLWRLGQEWDRLLSLLEDPESDQDAIQLELQRTAGDIRIKGAGLAIVLQGLDRLADWQRAEGQRLMAKARANEAHADRLRAYTLSFAFASVTGNCGNYCGPDAMGIDWMLGRELSQAIPPAYSRYLSQFIPLPAERAA